MANIYSRVELFYQENPDAEAIVSQEKVEQYFRRRAWHAASRHDMEREWRLLAQLIAYIDRGEFYSFESLTAMDYEEVLLRVRETNPEFLLSDENIGQAFATWRAFYKIALPDADRSLYDNLQAAEEECLALRDYRQEQQERRDQQEDIVSQFERDGISTQEMRQMDRQLNDLIEDVQDFYLREDHDADFNRAVYLFWGPEDHPNNPSSELKPEGAWQMFWDYFLFDYHLIGKDDTPFHHYYLECGAGFDRMQRLVAEFFLQARFHVFYVESFAEDYIACRDLLTEEKMELPLQELLHSRFRKCRLPGVDLRRIASPAQPVHITGRFLAGTAPQNAPECLCLRNAALTHASSGTIPGKITEQMQIFQRYRAALEDMDTLHLHQGILMGCTGHCAEQAAAADTVVQNRMSGIALRFMQKLPEGAFRQLLTQLPAIRTILAVGTDLRTDRCDRVGRHRDRQPRHDSRCLLAQLLYRSAKHLLLSGKAALADRIILRKHQIPVQLHRGCQRIDAAGGQHLHKDLGDPAASVKHPGTQHLHDKEYRDPQCLREPDKKSRQHCGHRQKQHRHAEADAAQGGAACGQCAAQRSTFFGKLPCAEHGEGDPDAASHIDP